VCQKFVTDLDSGTVSKYSVTNRETGEREQVDQPRPPGTLPPCQRCPKGSPEQAKEIELSERNWMALAFYEEEKSIGIRDEVKRDPIVRRNFAAIDRAYRERDLIQGAQLQASEFAKQFRKGK